MTPAAALPQPAPAALPQPDPAAAMLSPAPAAAMLSPAPAAAMLSPDPAEAMLSPDPAEAAFAAALIDPDRPVHAGVVGPDGRAAPRRFAVYRNNVAVSLVAALAETFPVVRETVGDAFFAGLARLFVVAHPPASPVLLRWGGAFPAFAEAFPPAASVPWLGDLARLEWWQVEAYHAADAPPLAPARLAAVAPDALADVAFVAHPAARLLRARHAVAALWLAHRGTGDLAAIDPARPEDVLVTRPDLTVEFRTLPPGAAAFAAALLAGDPLGAAAAAAFAEAPDFDLASALALLLDAGAFTDLAPEPAP